MLSDLSTAVSRSDEIDAAALDGDGRLDLIKGLARELDRLSAQLDRAIAAADAAGDVERTTPAAWVCWQTGMPKPAAKARLSRGRALRSMPGTEAAYRAGEIGPDRVRVLAAAHRANPAAFAEAEDELLVAARARRFDGFEREVSYFRQCADPDGAERDAEAARDGRHLHGSRSFENGVRVDGWLDAVGGTIWLTELQRLEQQLFEADWAEARERLGDAATVNDLARTPAQRRADAQVIMAVRSAAKHPNAREPRVLLQVLVGYETFAGRICQTADGTVLTPGQVATLLADADVQRIVFGSPSRIIDVGVKQRFFGGATRTAVEVRDRECQGHPACDVPMKRCQVDHIEPYEAGGPTVQANGRLLCPRCHRARRPPGRPPPRDTG